MKRNHFFIKIAWVLAFSTFFLCPLYAQDLSYDPYAPVYDENQMKGPSAWLEGLQNVLVLPFYLIKWPVDKMLLMTEKHYLDKKAIWIYERIQDKGISPQANFVSLGEMGGGVEVDTIRLSGLKERHPDLVVKGWIHWINDVRLKTGGEVGLDRINDTGFHAASSFDYENRPNEHFYGIGPNTSPGDAAVFSMETTTLKAKAGYSPNPLWSTDIYATYRNINISSGRSGGMGQRGEIATFSSQRIPGFYGDSIFTLGFDFVNDTRNQKENSTKGGIRRIGVAYHEGLHSSDARYMQYIVEASQYIRLGSERRVFAAHFYGEHNGELGSKANVPFHQMAKLGGYGVGGKRLSHTARGYEFNRFFDESLVLLNLEYRYAIWEYRELKMDTVAFYDVGQVFGEFSKMQFSDFRSSYGLGFRLSLASIPIFSIEMAHGDEGTNFYFKTAAPF